MSSAGQYVQQKTDSLRDNSRTELPIYIAQPDGSLVRAAAQESNFFHADVLFSYQPTPGTVFYAGYGTDRVEATAFRFHPFTRLDDALFVKLSYLFRM